MEIVRIVSVVIVCVIVIAILKTKNSEYAIIAEIAGIVIVALMAIGKLKSVLDESTAIFNSAGVLDDGYLVLLIKILGIAIVTQIASDICTDNGNKALSTNIELVGKIIILSLCMTLLKTLVTLSGGLLG